MAEHRQPVVPANPAAAGFFFALRFLDSCPSVAAAHFPLLFRPMTTNYQRRSLRNPEVQRAGPPLVGPDLRVPPAARDQSPAPRMDQRARAAGRQERDRHRLRRRHASESMARKGAKVTGIDLSKKALKVADLHSLESGVEVRYKLIAAEDMAAEEAGPVRRRDLHGNAGTRAGSGLDRARRGHPGQTGRPRVLLDPEPQPQVLPVRRDRRRVRAAHAAARHPRLRQIHHPGRTVAASSAPPACRSTA
jgi:hypothetical protein